MPSLLLALSLPPVFGCGGTDETPNPVAVAGSGGAPAGGSAGMAPGGAADGGGAAQGGGAGQNNAAGAIKAAPAGAGPGRTARARAGLVTMAPLAAPRRRASRPARPVGTDDIGAYEYGSD